MNKKIAIITLTLLLGLCLSYFATAFSVLDIAPNDFNAELPKEISEEAAEEALVEAEEAIEEMNRFNFITLLPNDALTEAKQSYADENYEKVFELTQFINYIKKEKIDFFDQVKLLEIKKQALEEKGVEDVTEVNTLMQQAMNSFNFEQLDEARTFLEAADEKADELGKEHARVKTVALLSKNFFVRYWWQSLIVLVILLVGGSFVSMSIRKRMLRRKINRLNLESKKTKELIKKLQKECFIDKKITTHAYKEQAEKYEERINEIKQILPVLEADLKTSKRKKTVTKKSSQRIKKKSGKKRLKK